MSYVSLEKCVEKTDGSLYKLALMVARRAHSLTEGAKHLTGHYDSDKPINTALQEIAEGHVELARKKKKDV